MNKLIPIFLSAVVLLGFTSCDKSDDTYDTLAVLPLGTSHTIYADQTVDSVTVVSTKDVELVMNETWFSVQSSDKTIKVSQMIQKTLPVYFQINNTGEPRIGYMYAKSNGETVGHCFYQTSWLNIEVPSPVYAYGETGYPKGVSFTQKVAVADQQVKIEFTLYSDNATLTSDASWAVVGNDDQALDKGKHEVTITLGEHSKGMTANLTLKAASGISSVIKLVCEE